MKNLYGCADPTHSQSFSTPAGQNGIRSYQPLYKLIAKQRRRSGRRPAALPIVIGETGWFGANQTLKAQSFVAALQQVFFEDVNVAAVIPFLLASFQKETAQYKAWVQWEPGAMKPFEQETEYLATKALRCAQHVGGRKWC